MIIVEGPDGAGKTTLIAKIREAYPDLDVAPRVVSKETKALTDMQDWVNQNLNEGFQYRLFDRHRLISEFVYGPVLRANMQHPGFDDPSWVYWSLRKFYHLDPVIIYCLPPFNAVQFNVNQGDDNIAVQDSIKAIYAGYAHRMALDIIAGRTVLHYDYTVDYVNADPLAIVHPYITAAYERAFK